MMLELANVTAGARETTTPEPRLARAAHEFEAQMMKELLEPLTRKDTLFQSEGDEDSGILGEFASESLGRAVSAGGGLGIADRITHTLSTSAGASAHGAIQQIHNHVEMNSSR